MLAPWPRQGPSWVVGGPGGEFRAPPAKAARLVPWGGSKPRGPSQPPWPQPTPFLPLVVGLGVLRVGLLGSYPETPTEWVGLACSWPKGGVGWARGHESLKGLSPKAPTCTTMPSPPSSSWVGKPLNKAGQPNPALAPAWPGSPCVCGCIQPCWPPHPCPPTSLHVSPTPPCRSSPMSKAKAKPIIKAILATMFLVSDHCPCCSHPFPLATPCHVLSFQPPCPHSHPFHASPQVSGPCNCTLCRNHAWHVR